MSSKLALVSVLTVVAAPLTAEATLRANGKDLNGKDLNGKDLNGKDLNGKDLNGKDLNGVTISGTQVTGWVDNSFRTGSGMVGARFNMLDASGNVIGTIKIETAGTLAWPNNDVWAYNVSAEYWVWGCAHYGYTEGVRLDRNCSNVEGAVIARDPYCGSTRWDSICVTKFWEEYNKVGGAWSYYWHLHQEASACGQEGDQDGYWWSTRAPRKGIFLNGRWDQREGVLGAGGKINNGKTFACLPAADRRGGGAIAKCVTDGYKPWVSNLDYLHQACVRMYRADFCGDGTSWTTNGTEIDIEDQTITWVNGVRYDSHIQRRSMTWYFDNLLPLWHLEAVWTPSGASGVNQIHKARTGGSGSTTLEQYKLTHPYCPRLATDSFLIPSVMTGQNALSLYSGVYK